MAYIGQLFLYYLTDLAALLIFLLEYYIGQSGMPNENFNVKGDQTFKEAIDGVNTSLIYHSAKERAMLPSVVAITGMISSMAFAKPEVWMFVIIGFYLLLLIVDIVLITRCSYLQYFRYNKYHWLFTLVLILGSLLVKLIMLLL